LRINEKPLPSLPEQFNYALRTKGVGKKMKSWLDSGVWSANWVCGRSLSTYRCVVVFFSLLPVIQKPESRLPEQFDYALRKKGVEKMIAAALETS